MTRLDTRTHRAWTRDNPVLADGELVAEKETGRLKIGDGVTRYNSLPFTGSGASSLTRDKIESKLYDKAYSWELVPGSDVMATTVAVLPKIGVAGEWDYYAGLITVDGTPFDRTSWGLVPADTVLTLESLDASSHVDYTFPNPDDLTFAVVPAGVYIAWYFVPVGSPPPYAFPEGWTPGNTTGSGPVLPYLGLDAEGKWPIYAGLVEYVAPSLPWQQTSEGSWYLAPADTPLTYAGADHGSGDIPTSTVAPQMWLAVYYPSSSSGEAPFGPPPTAFPEGWTFRPYGLGPIAITDENAGGVIGDIAYVVSGYVYNGPTVFGPEVEGNWRGVLPAGDISLAVGDTFIAANNPDYVYRTTTAGVVTVTGASGPIIPDDTVAFVAVTLPSMWPYIERFDLAQKKWLPRIPMPVVEMTFTDRGAWDGDTFYNQNDFVTYEGATWYVVYLGFQTDTPPPEIPEYWSASRPNSPRYAAEGGIAGVIDGKLYFGGGEGDDIIGDKFFVYDPADDSITRLADMPSNYPDYWPYGVVGGRLYYVDDNGGYYKVVSYDVAEDQWVAEDVTGDGHIPADQIQGFEIDGKLWFIYDGKAFVFDPVALTVEAKAVTSTLGAGLPGGIPTGTPFLINAKVEVFEAVRTENYNLTGELLAATYDPADDTWTPRTDVVSMVGLPGYPCTYDSEFVGVTYEGVPFMLSSIASTNHTGMRAGVYGLTGVALDKPQPQRFDEADDAAAISAALEAAEEQFVDFKIYSASPAIGGSFINASVVPVRMAKPRSGESVSQAVSIPLAEFAQDAPVFYARVKDTTQDPKLTASLTVVVSDGATYYKTWAGYLTGDNTPDFYGSAVPLSVTASSGPPPHLTLDSSESQVLTDAAASYTVSATLTLTRA